jgi:triosephosphate isomerase
MIMQRPGRVRLPRRWAWTGAVAAGFLVAATAMMVPLLHHESRPQPAAQETTAGTDSASPVAVSGSVVCASEDTSCSRRTADLARRQVLTAAESRTAEAAFDRVVRAVEPGASNCTGAPAPCADSVTAARKALQSAGYQDITVRVADGDDIAAPGSLIAVVGIGPACVMVVQGPGGLTSGSWAGRLPGGACLA